METQDARGCTSEHFIPRIVNVEALKETDWLNSHTLSEGHSESAKLMDKTEWKECNKVPNHDPDIKIEYSLATVFLDKKNDSMTKLEQDSTNKGAEDCSDINIKCSGLAVSDDSSSEPQCESAETEAELEHDSKSSDNSSIQPQVALGQLAADQVEIESNKKHGRVVQSQSKSQPAKASTDAANDTEELL